MFKYLNKKVDGISEKIVKDPELNKSFHSKMALRDAAILLTYCYKRFDTIVDNDEDLNVIFRDIIC